MKPEEFPPCPKCGCATTWRPTKLTTDVYSVPREDTVNGTGMYSSHRELTRKMKERGWEPAGDKVGGARNEEHLKLGKSFSYDGQETKREGVPLQGRH